jgi:signal transduction histidine kinase
MKIVDAIVGQSRRWLFIEALIWVAAVGVLDTYTPREIRLFSLYAVPIFLISFRFGQRDGIVFALSCDLVSWLADRFTMAHESATLGAFTLGWAFVNRGVAFVFVAMCGAYLCRIREETRKRLEAIEHAQKLEREVVRVGDREQMRIGQDLHDGVCQNLAALDCATECLKVELESAGSPQAITAQQIQKLLKETTVEARNLARGLVPVALEPDGLVTALRSLVTTTGAIRHARIDFESNDDVELKDADVAVHLYRIAQEALSNAMRHANASRVTVSVTRDNGALHIAVSDDGVGSATQARPDGMGWRTMRYRAKLIGATIKVETRPAGGTTIRCTLPMSMLAAA